MNKTTKEYLEQPYARVLTPEDDGSYYAEILEFSGCFAIGKNAEEAIKNLNQTAEDWIEQTIELGKKIPEPVASYKMSGRFLLRLPESVHSKAAILAERDGISLNTFILSSLATRIGTQDCFSKMYERFENHFFGTNRYLNLNAPTRTTSDGSSMFVKDLMLTEAK